MQQFCLVCGEEANYTERNSPDRAFCSKECQRRGRGRGRDAVDISTNLAQLRLQQQQPIGEGILTRMIRKPYQPKRKDIKDLERQLNSEPNEQRRNELFERITALKNQQTGSLNRDTFFKLISSLDKWPVQRIIMDLMDDSSISMKDYHLYLKALKKVIKWMMQRDSGTTFQDYFNVSQGRFLSTLFRDAVKAKAWKIVTIMLELFHKDSQRYHEFSIPYTLEMHDFIYHAVESNDVHTIRLLNYTGAINLNQQNDSFYLRRALRNKQKDMVEAILENSTKFAWYVDDLDMEFAAGTRDLEIFQMLLAHVADPTDHYTAFERLIDGTVKFGGSVQEVSAVVDLIKNNFPGEQDYFIPHVIDAATRYNRLDIFNAFYALLPVKEKQYPLEWTMIRAMEFRAHDIFDFLLSRNPNVKKDALIQGAIQHNDTRCLVILVQDPNVDLSAAFVEALSKQKLDMIRIIVSQPHFDADLSKMTYGADAGAAYLFELLSDEKNAKYLDIWDILFAQEAFRNYLSANLHELVQLLMEFPDEQPENVNINGPYRKFKRLRQILTQIPAIGQKMLTRVVYALVTGSDDNLRAVQWILTELRKPLTKKYIQNIMEGAWEMSSFETFLFLMGIKDFRSRVPLSFVMKALQEVQKFTNANLRNQLKVILNSVKREREGDLAEAKESASKRTKTVWERDEEAASFDDDDSFFENDDDLFSLSSE